jgi:hypothetical protein
VGGCVGAGVWAAWQYIWLAEFTIDAVIPPLGPLIDGSLAVGGFFTATLSEAILSGLGV